MRQHASLTRDHRTLTVDFQPEATDSQLLDDGKAWRECGCACRLALGFQLQHKATCRGGGGLTRPSPDVRVRLGGVTLWRLQGITGKAVFTVLPHVVLRDRSTRPEVARDARLATHGGLSLEWGAVRSHLSPMALDRLSCALGQQPRVTGLTRGGLALPVYVLAAAKPRQCLTDKGYRPTSVSGRVLWHLDSIAAARAVAWTQSSRAFHRAAVDQEPTSRVRGLLRGGVDSPTKSLHTLFPGARWGNCLRHALSKLPQQLAASAAPVRKAWRLPCHPLWYRARQRQG